MGRDGSSGSRLPKPLGRTRRRTTGGTTPSPAVPQCLELQCCRVADGFAMLIEVADGELPTLLGRENALRLAEAIRDAHQEGDGQETSLAAKGEPDAGGEPDGEADH